MWREFEPYQKTFASEVRVGVWVYKKTVEMIEGLSRGRQKVALRVADWSVLISGKLITTSKMVRKFLSGSFRIRPFWDFLRFLFYLVKTRNLNAASAVSTFTGFYGFNLIPGVLFAIAILLFIPLFPRILLSGADLLSPFVFEGVGNGANAIGDGYLYLVNSKKVDIEKVRNIGLIVIGPLGFLLIAWRTWTASKQASLAEIGLNVDRFRKGCEMLTDDHFTARHAGVVTLRELAISRPKDYEILVLDVLANFMRTPDKKNEETPSPTPESRPDVEAAFYTITNLWKRPSTRARYCREYGMLKLQRIDLTSFTLTDLCLRNVDFTFSTFTNCLFTNVDFDGSSFRRVIFTSSDFFNCSFKKASLKVVDVIGTSFSGSQWSGAHFEGIRFDVSNVSYEIEGKQIMVKKKGSIRLADLTSAWFSPGSVYEPFRNPEKCSPPFSYNAYLEHGVTKLRITEIEPSTSSQ